VSPIFPTEIFSTKLEILRRHPSYINWVSHLHHLFLIVSFPHSRNHFSKSLYFGGLPGR
jgi:hypothetical protein